ncbi:MAG: enoyl-CoA hydratase/isomerase family protein [Chloroflexi bacterium]|nr:enoyl-CoA hydratase/isomerase family protein [Chloroflexota bacterium]
MPYENVLLEAGPVATLTLNRPEARNALNGPHMRDIIGALRELDAAPDVRVVVVRGAGRGFCAGADIGEFLGRGVMAARDYLAAVPEMFEQLHRMSKPVIAQVHGFALAGGCGLAVGCDLGIAAEDAVFGLPEINIGVWAYNVMAPLLRTVPRKVLLELLMTGERIDGREAARIGMVNRAVPAEQLEGAVRELADKLAAKSAATMKLGRQAFYTMADMDYLKSFQYAREMLVLNTLTEDGQEGPRAFKEKRPPRWMHR